MAWFRGRPKQHPVAQLHVKLENSFARVRSDTMNLYAWINHINNKLDYLHYQVKHAQHSLNTIHQRTPSGTEIIKQIYSHPGWLDFSVRMGKTQAEIERLHQTQKEHKEELHKRIDQLPAYEFNLEEKFHTIQDRIARIQERIGDEHFEAHLDRLDAQMARVKFDIEPLKSQVFETHHRELEAIKEKMDQKPAKSALHVRLLNTFKRNSKPYAHSMILQYVKKYERITVQRLKEMLVDEQAVLSKSAFYRHIDEVEKSENVAMVKEGKNKVLFYSPKSRVE